MIKFLEEKPIHDIAISDINAIFTNGSIQEEDSQHLRASLLETVARWRISVFYEYLILLLRHLIQIDYLVKCLGLERFI